MLTGVSWLGVKNPMGKKIPIQSPSIQIGAWVKGLFVVVLALLKHHLALYIVTMVRTPIYYFWIVSKT
jgi:hypothetical protein